MTECPMIYAPCAECNGTCSKATVTRINMALSASKAEVSRYDRLLTYSLVAAWLFATGAILSIVPEAFHRQTLSYQTP